MDRLEFLRPHPQIVCHLSGEFERVVAPADQNPKQGRDAETGDDGHHQRHGLALAKRCRQEPLVDADLDLEILPGKPERAVDGCQHAGGLDVGAFREQRHGARHAASAHRDREPGLQPPPERPEHPIGVERQVDPPQKPGLALNFGVQRDVLKIDRRIHELPDRRRAFRVDEELDRRGGFDDAAPRRPQHGIAPGRNLEEVQAEDVLRIELGRLHQSDRGIQRTHTRRQAPDPRPMLPDHPGIVAIASARPHGPHEADHPHGRIVMRDVVALHESPPRLTIDIRCDGNELRDAGENSRLAAQVLLQGGHEILGAQIDPLGNGHPPVFGGGLPPPDGAAQHQAQGQQGQETVAGMSVGQQGLVLVGDRPDPELLGYRRSRNLPLEKLQSPRLVRPCGDQGETMSCASATRVRGALPSALLLAMTIALRPAMSDWRHSAAMASRVETSGSTIRLNGA